MPLDRQQVEHIASLARIGLTDEEIELFRQQLSHILEQFEILDELDTAGIQPTGHAVDLHGVLREDEAQGSLTSEDTLRNAPRREGDFIRVKAVLEE
jgi:aspartyl-tRNA(Asn)/glutamyl-tRNA(Gln) amidotransferase subunit C